VKLIIYKLFVMPVTVKRHKRKGKMLEEVNYWLSLMQQEEYEELELELKEYQLRLMPTLEPSDIPTLELDEAINIAEDYFNE
jgi:hypothetical protein